MCVPADGRVYFTVPKLFEASLCLRGGQPNDGWFFVHAEFLITVGGDLTGTQGLRQPGNTSQVIYIFQSFLEYRRES